MNTETFTTTITTIDNDEEKFIYITGRDMKEDEDSTAMKKAFNLDKFENLDRLIDRLVYTGDHFEGMINLNKTNKKDLKKLLNSMENYIIKFDKAVGRAIYHMEKSVVDEEKAERYEKILKELSIKILDKCSEIYRVYDVLMYFSETFEGLIRKFSFSCHPLFQR